ncbi:hypothetical protein [Actinomadura spongiicola]|uniref:hypothetical protein n=1 Tax=Actinomadura spongiicola TaxID=2303421 RepID=UPI0011C17627|nr:hypothetical protein [Actinomadura spongiicola]
MSIEAKVKAANIRKLGEEMKNIGAAHLPNAKDILNEISVGFPGFSVLGLPLHFAHERLKKEAMDNIDSAREQMGTFQEALIKTALTWSTADDTSAATIDY